MTYTPPYSFRVSAGILPIYGAREADADLRGTPERATPPLTCLSALSVPAEETRSHVTGRDIHLSPSSNSLLNSLLKFTVGETASKDEGLVRGHAGAEWRHELEPRS